MCGIFGFSKRTPATERMMPFLAWEMVERGKDSWGVTDGTTVEKHLGPITQSWYLPPWGDALIFHTRAASVGSKTLQNQHPFTFSTLDNEGETSGGYVVGVHNGGISNHEKLNKDYQRDFDVDSMHVYAHIAEGWDTKELNGYGALAWFEVDNNANKILYFAKFNMYDFSVFRLDDGAIVFCSRGSVVRKAAEMTNVEVTEYKFQDEMLYWVSVEEDGTKHILIEGDEMKFGAGYQRGRNYATPNYSGNDFWNGYDNNRFNVAWCSKCHSLQEHCTCKTDQGTTTNTHVTKSTVVTESDISSAAKALIVGSGFATVTDTAHAVDCRKCRLIKVQQNRALLCQDCLMSLFKDFQKKADMYEYE